MKSFLVGLIAIAALAFTPPAQAQQSSQKVGDSGTTVRLIKTGRATLVAGVVTITDSAATAAAEIFYARQVDAGTPGVTLKLTRTAGTSFTLTSKAADGTTTATSDTSVVAYWLVQHK